MLSLDHLLEEAKQNGLPQLKRRGIVREYLQVMILNGLYKNALGKRLMFTGGTALRFFYDVPRFSEDLDFDTNGMMLGEFKQLAAEIQKGLKREGFSSEVSVEKRKRLLLAEICLPDALKHYQVLDGRGIDLRIKLDVYQPPWPIRSEPGVMSLYGYHVTGVLLAKGHLFSEKLVALVKRTRGRDIYDTLMLLQKGFPMDRAVLRANKIRETPQRLITACLDALSKKKLKFLADQVKPFLFRKDDYELVLKAPDFARRFLKCEER